MPLPSLVAMLATAAVTEHPPDVRTNKAMIGSLVKLTIELLTGLFDRIINHDLIPPAFGIGEACNSQFPALQFTVLSSAPPIIAVSDFWSILKFLKFAKATLPNPIPAGSERYLRDNSTGASSFKLGRIDGDHVTMRPIRAYTSLLVALVCLVRKFTGCVSDDNDVDDDFINGDGDNETVAMQPVLQKNEAKLAIEQLILQETFSWDECVELTKIIESRVVDSSTNGAKVAMQEKLHSWPFRSELASPGAWRSITQSGNSTEPFPYSASILGAHSYSAYVAQAQSPDIRDIAIMKARKWIEEKRMEPSSKSNVELESNEPRRAMLPHVSTLIS
ncbi:hypothetical protein ACLOJK_035459 [Asimina triloba]